MTQPTGPEQPAPPTQPAPNPANQYGTARKQRPPWYRRAARRAKNGLRRALLPMAIGTALAGAAIGGFEAGRSYQAYDDTEESLEQRLMYKKDEIKVIKKDGVIYYQRKLELEQVIDPTRPRPQMLQYNNKQSI